MKDKTTAAIFALFLGWAGIHRFYLRQPMLGILYLILIASGISVILGIIDAIVLLAMDPEEFDRKYNDKNVRPDYTRYNRRYQRRDNRGQQRQRYERRSEPKYERREAPSRQRQRRRQAPRRKTEIPKRQRHNPFKASGIKKYKDFDLENAIEDFKKGLEISPRDVSIHFNLACAYSLTEQVDKAYYHLDRAVAFGFRDFEKIKSHDDLAYVRIQDRFDSFAENGFRLSEAQKPQSQAPPKEEQQQLEAPKENLLDDDLLLSQLKRLAELRDKGLLTEQEFQTEKKKLMR